MNYLTKTVSHIALILRKTYVGICVNCRFKAWSVVFFGSDSFSLFSLKALFNCIESGQIQKLEIVCLSNETVVYEFALEKNLKVHFWPPKFTDHYDIGVVVSFGKLIPKNIIEYFPLGIINVHPSLLPLYRGPMPIFHTLKNGESLTGVSIMKIKPFKFDTGDIISQEQCAIHCEELMPGLFRKLAELGSKCLVDTIKGLPASLDNQVPQSGDKVSYAPKITKAIAIVQWDKMTASEVYNLYRSLYGKYDLKTTWHSKSVKLFCISPKFYKQSKLFSKTCKLPPGAIEYCRVSRGIRIYCVDKPVYICSFQVKDKMLTAFDFYQGYLCKVPRDEWFFK